MQLKLTVYKEKGVLEATDDPDSFLFCRKAEYDAPNGAHRRGLSGSVEEWKEVPISVAFLAALLKLHSKHFQVLTTWKIDSMKLRQEARKYNANVFVDCYAFDLPILTNRRLD